MWGKIKIRPADAKFSRYLRKKRKYRCEYDGQFFPEGRGLTVSHYFSRRNESVRFDTVNCDVLCVKHHMYFEEHKTEYQNWKAKKIGALPFAHLCIRAHTTQRRDDKAIMLWLKLVQEEEEGG